MGSRWQDLRNDGGLASVMSDWVWWDNFKPTDPPKSATGKSGLDLSVPPDTNIDGGAAGEIPMGPKKVFKRGYPTVNIVECNKGDRMPRMSKIVASDQVDLLSTHGVADGSQVHQILHPEELTVIQSLANERAFIVTKEFKIIDISAHEWPINLEAATDVRTRLKSVVKYADEIGVVAGISGDFAMITTKAGDVMVAISDLDPIMAAQYFRVVSGNEVVYEGLDLSEATAEFNKVVEMDMPGQMIVSNQNFTESRGEVFREYAPKPQEVPGAMPIGASEN